MARKQTPDNSDSGDPDPRDFGPRDFGPRDFGREDFDQPELDDSSDESFDLDHHEGDDQRDTGFCPDCGAEIYDAAEICPKCFAWIDGDTFRHSPRRRRATDRWKRIVVWSLIGAIASGLGIFAILGLVR